MALATRVQYKYWDLQELCDELRQAGKSKGKWQEAYGDLVMAREALANCQKSLKKLGVKYDPDNTWHAEMDVE